MTFRIEDQHGNPIDLTKPGDILNELMLTKETAAARCGITVKQFGALVKERIFPSPALKCSRWDRKNLYACLKIRKGITNRIDPGYIYFMEMGDFIKIGWSMWPASRREALQIGNPYDIKILGAFPGDKDNELGLHTLFAHARSRGEWFRKTPGLVAYIAWLKVAWRGDARMIRGDHDNVVRLGERETGPAAPTF